MTYGGPRMDPVAVTMSMMTFIKYIKSMLPQRHFEAAKRAVLAIGGIVLALVFLAVVTYITASPTLGWTGRSLFTWQDLGALPIEPTPTILSERSCNSFPFYSS